MSSCGTIHKSVVSHLYFCRVLPLLLEPWDYTGIRWRKADTQRNERKLQLPMNNHETEGAGGQAATRPTALRNTNTGSTLVFFLLLFTSWLEDKMIRGNVNQKHQYLVVFFFTFYSWFEGTRLQQATGHFGREIDDDKSTSQAQCGWGASPTMLIGTTGLSPPPGGKWLLCEGLRSTPDQRWIWFFVWKLWLKTWKGKKW